MSPVQGKIVSTYLMVPPERAQSCEQLLNCVNWSNSASIVAVLVSTLVTDDKGKPFARRGRKATGLLESAGLPNRLVDGH